LCAGKCLEKEQYLKITFTLAPGMRLLCIKSYPLAEGSKLKNDMKNARIEVAGDFLYFKFEN